MTPPERLRRFPLGGAYGQPATPSVRGGPSSVSLSWGSERTSAAYGVWGSEQSWWALGPVLSVGVNR